MNDYIQKIINLFDDSQIKKHIKLETIEGIFEDKNIVGLGLYDNEIEPSKRHRYYLYVNLGKSKNKKKLTIIMLNPSEYQKEAKGGIFIDQTIANVLKIAKDEDFLEIEILNLFSIINSNSINVKEYFKQNKKYYDINQTNTDFILKIVETSENILIAWGDKFKNTTRHKQAQSIIEKLKTNSKGIFTLCKKNRNYPKHPGRLNLVCCQHCHGSEEKIKLVEYKF